MLKRKADFDPTDDSIVRVQISHLRKKLDQFDAAEGQAEKFRVFMPKGTYIPRFEKRRPARHEEATIPAADHTELQTAQSAKSKLWIAAVALAVLAVAAFVIWQVRVQRNTQESQTGAIASGRNTIASRIFSGPSPTTVVVADTSLSLVEDTLRTEVSVKDYADQSRIDNLIASVKDPAAREILRMAEARVTPAWARPWWPFDVWKRAGHFTVLRASGMRGTCMFATLKMGISC